MNKPKFFFFVFALLAIISLSFSVNAATFTGLINLTGSNTTVNVTNTWTYDSLRVDDTSFTVSNLTQSGAVTSDVVSFNFSEANKRYIGTDLPLFTASTNAQKTLTSNVQTLNNVGVRIAVAQCVAKRVTYTTSNASVNQEYEGSNCEGNTFVAIVSKVENGANTFSITDFVGGTSSSILTSGLAAILAIVIIIFFARAYLNYDDWSVKEWIMYFIIGLIVVFLMTILINTIFSIT